MNKKQLSELRKKIGTKGGRSRSPAKVKASRISLEQNARPGKAIAKLIRDVETKMLRNREIRATTLNAERFALDLQFEKLTKVRDAFKKKKNSACGLVSNRA